MSAETFDYDYIVFGGGSGGLASAKRAAALGKKVAVIEKARLGGTCVNVGCVPKKIMFMAATMMDTMKHDAAQYCFRGMEQKSTVFDWRAMKERRDKYIVKLNTIYGGGLERAGVAFFAGNASFVNATTISIEMVDGSTKTISAPHVLIATGGRPNMPPGEGVEEFCINSDGFFELEELPPVVVMVGAGYIAVELAGVLNALGSEVHLVLRKGKALREFDPDISDQLDAEMTKQGIILHRNTNGVAKVTLDSKGKKIVHTAVGDMILDVDVVIMATGRVPNVEHIGLEAAGVTLNSQGYIDVDEYQSSTSASGIYALGDVCGKVELTPMAIAAGRRLADRLFGGHPTAKVSYQNVPTVVFSHPTIGTCGLTEPQAIAKYGQEHIQIYKSKFVNLYYGIFDMESDDKPKTLMKLICAGVEEKVVGLHVIGMGADEMMQGFGVAMKMGCTKADLDSCIAIHPTAAEEFVTMGTWGTSPLATGVVHSPLMGAPPAEPKLE